MSANITDKNHKSCEYQEQRHCGEDISFNHDTGEMKGHIPLEKRNCNCHKNIYKEQYEKLIAEAEAARDEFLAKALMFSEATTKEVEQMFDGFMVDDTTMDLPSMDIDEQGYVALDIEVDKDGYVRFNNYLND